MNEYIITEKQLKTATEAYLEHEIPLPITEVFVSGDKLPEIVRCRDCTKWHMNDVNEDGSMRGSCDEWTHLDGFTHTTRDDGFCACGERRDA